jgi:hypothetical protein
VLASGQGERALRDFSKNERNVAYVRKPFNAKDLIGALGAVGIAGIRKQ